MANSYQIIDEKTWKRAFVDGLYIGRFVDRLNGIYDRLWEETGALQFQIQPVCVYSVSADKSLDGQESFGMLYYAELQSMEEELHKEIERIIVTDRLPEQWTYPEIQPELLKEARRRGFL